MKIMTAWIDNGDGYSLVSAYSETDYDNWAGVPDWYANDVKRASHVRELVIEIPDAAIRALFAAPVVQGTVTA